MLPTREYGIQFLRTNGFGEVVIHARSQADRPANFAPVRKRCFKLKRFMIPLMTIYLC
jgi:hypothetical protein